MWFTSRRKRRKVKEALSAAGPWQEVTRWLGSDRVQGLREALGKAGVQMNGPSSGQITGDDFVADVRLEPDDLIRVRCAVDHSAEPRELLQRLAGAQGCVRYGLGPKDLQLAAETRVDGVAHLPESLGEIRHGFSLAVQPAAPPPDAHAEETVELVVRDALQQAGLSKEDVVETADGFELQPRIAGSHVAVQVVFQPGAALVQRTLLPALPGGTAGTAVAHQALLWNLRVRCCRIAVDESRLLVESRLRADQINGEWLLFVVRAVAAAARSIQPELELLVREPDVAKVYADMFRVVPTQEPSQ